MKRLLMTALVLGCAVIGLPGLASATFGPGPHWVDTVSAGTDIFLDSTAILMLNGGPLGPNDVVFNLEGATMIQRTGALDDSIQFPGTNPVDGHLDVIDIEIIQMQLVSVGPLLPTVRVGSNFGLPATRGMIFEIPTDPIYPESFFDVFIEIDLPGGVTLHNQTPFRMDSVLDQWPSNAPYSWLGELELFDANDELSEVLLKGFEFNPNIPEPAVMTLLAVGGLALLKRRRKA